MPKVSIVLPTYNGEKYICESVDSVLNQTFADFELIIVDDCSTDSTPEIIGDFAQKDNRIKIIHNKENKRLPESLNIGFRESKGEYLTWTSDDNIYLPNAIATMVSVLNEKKDTYMVCTDMDLINDIGEIIGKANKHSNDTIYINDNVGACFLYRAEVLKEIGEYDTSMALVEDYDYWIRVYKKYGYIERIDEVLYKYRWHNNSLTFSKAKEIRNQLNKLREKHGIWTYFENKGELPFEMYYDYLMYREISYSLLEEIWGKFPELKIECENVKNYKLSREILVFGSGQKGREANQILGDKVKFFVDNNPDKVGEFVNGKKIISFEELLKIHDKYDIIIAVNPAISLQIMGQLISNNIEHFISWNMYEIVLEEHKLWEKENFLKE